MASANDPALDPIIVLASSRAVITLPNSTVHLTPATITISPQTGKITSIAHELLPASAFPPNTPYTDYSPRILLPGLVDAHVHLNEPGRTAWEGFWTGTRAAASGGVTTVIDMPLNAIPPTISVAALEEKVRASRGQCWVDVGFYGGVVPGNAAELRPLVDAGVCGFKGFLIDSGVDEFPAISSEDVALAMDTLKDSPTTLMFHAEMAPSPSSSTSDDQTKGASSASNNNTQNNPSADPTSYQTFLDSRPPTLETRAVAEILRLAPRAPSLHLHIVHLSATQCIPLLREARARGVNVTAETCFHYLGLAAEDIPAGDTWHKCCPPIREARNCDALWAELVAADSCIRTVVSDHSPCTPELKLLPPKLQARTEPAAASTEKKGAGDFMTAWGGIASVGLGLSILHTEATRRQLTSGCSIVDMVRLCCRAPAEQVGLAHRKGALREGMDADICVFDDACVWTVSPADMRWKNRCSPWEGHEFVGRVTETWLRGRKIFELGKGEGGFVVDEPLGESITEKRTR